MSKKLTAEEIAEKADRGEDVTRYLSKPQRGFANILREKKVQRTTIDFGMEMLADLDSIASRLNISRQAVVKMALQEFLTRYYMGEEAKSSQAAT